MPAEKRGPLIDKLLDYIDPDDLHRLNGAEAEQYQAQGLVPPPNRFFVTSWEARNVLDWGEQSELWNMYCLPRLTTVARGGMPNFNTAPKLVLQTITGIDDETAARIIAAREERPFGRLSDVVQAAGKDLPLDPMELVFLPSPRLRLTFWYQGARHMREIHVQLTPVAANGMPWLIDYQLSMPLIQEQKHETYRQFSTAIFATPVSAESE